MSKILFPHSDAKKYALNEMEKLFDTVRFNVFNY